MAARAAALAPWLDMSPAEIRGHRATADKPASREIKSLLADVATVVGAVMPKEAAAVAIEAVAIEAAGIEAEAGIKAAEKKAIEEFQWRRMK